MAVLKANRNERGIQNWKKLGSQTGKLKSFGIGLTVLRKLAKQIGRDHALALDLWKSDVYDAKIIALLIDDPRQITRKQAEAQVERLQQGLLAHVFSSCDASLGKTPFVVELAGDWIRSKDAERRRCGYGLLYEVSKSKKVPLRDRCSFGRFPWLISQALSVTYMAGERRLYLERNCRLPESPAHSRRRNLEGPASSKGLNSQRGFGPAVEPRRKSRPRSTSLHGSSPCKCAPQHLAVGPAAAEQALH